jgi:cell division transport system permease protein
LQQTDLVSLNPQGAKEIDFPQDVVQELSRWTNGVRTAGLVLILVLSLVCILTIVTIISMKISGRRSEIATMKLLGASNSFIIKPYLHESIIYGFLGGLIGWSLTFIVILY